VHTQFTGQRAYVIAQFHPPDGALLKFLRVPLLLRHRRSPFNEKCRSPLCLNLGAQSSGDRYKIIDTCVAEKSRCVAGIVHIACNINIL
jgi:hypothetical protein